jgi:hypothetical protein
MMSNGRFWPASRISALSGCLRDKWRGCVLNLLAAALRASRMSGFMFSKMLGMFEHFTALLAPVLVSRHGIPPTRIPRVVLARYCRRGPQPGIIHSSAGTRRKRRRMHLTPR